MLEDAFFLEQDRLLKDRLQAMKNLARTKEAISSVSGITNDAVLERLVALDVKPETVAALAAVPLIEVAWADGRIDPAERVAVLNHANGIGIVPGSVEHELLERWLTHRPSPQLMTAWQTCLKGLCEPLSAATGAQLFAKGFGGTDLATSLANATGTWAKMVVSGIAVSNGKCSIGISTSSGTLTADDFSLVRE